ncbi:3-hydroxybutyrate dehydrogenase [Actinospica durhamensis]|uniref:3-hydroxybutyrate dehydrogenase n=1 Tax=Actinospica durhamensis TaxID=1508375 RepID=A0A941ENA9_9ACTN|nr:3-hydroxybutyrate dehydrogenase [Actinospica durhamensis]MBR7834205.1 3-hydroxybutyrate dehydrogenase [Actinospica durhamensis]
MTRIVDAAAWAAGGGRVDLGGRTAVVTGAASGIGRACAEALAGAGAKVRVLDLDAEGARRVAEAVGGEAHPVDLADPAAAAPLAADADIVVNNAGFQVVRPLEQFPPEVFHRMLTVMVEAPFHLVRAALPHMYGQSWGRIVNISSVHGLRASAYKVGYVTAKHALEGLSKVAAVEGGAHGVTSNCVNPGYVRTPLVEKQIAEQAAAHGIGEQEVVEKVLLARSATKRLIEPGQVADLVLYLCSPSAAFVNGASLAMDGAWTAQ